MGEGVGNGFGEWGQWFGLLVLDPDNSDASKGLYGAEYCTRKYPTAAAGGRPGPSRPGGASRASPAPREGTAAGAPSRPLPSERGTARQPSPQLKKKNPPKLVKKKKKKKKKK